MKKILIGITVAALSLSAFALGGFGMGGAGGARPIGFGVINETNRDRLKAKLETKKVKTEVEVAKEEEEHKKDQERVAAEWALDYHNPASPNYDAARVEAEININNIV